MKLEAAFKARCERIAVDWRYRVGRRPIEPLPSNIILDQLQIVVITPDEIPRITPQQAVLLVDANDWFGALLPLQPPAIVVHPHQSPARLQSTLMHEIAHLILAHPYVGFDIHGLPLRDARCELEAIHLGGCLQLPRLAVQWAVDNHMTVEQTAVHFDASVEMVRYRANMTLPGNIRRIWMKAL
jgi:Zn-dependent peptidase ImmA (M78 family)